MRSMPDLPGSTHHYLDVRGAKLHAVEVGSGPPIVLVHGWPQYWWCWRDVMTRLQDSARVIAVDLRGFGESEATPRGYEKEELAKDLIGVLDALGLEKVQLVGHDWGGVVGFLACLQAPERFERYLALNTGHPWARAQPKLLPTAWRFSYQWVMASPGLGTRAAASRRWLKFIYSMATVRKAPVMAAFDHYATNLAEPARARAAQQMYRTFTLKELPAWFRGAYRDQRLEVPLLWLHGKGDAAIRPEMIESIGEHADDATLEYVDGVGHFIVEEAPELVADRARTFFALNTPVPA